MSLVKDHYPPLRRSSHASRAISTGVSHVLAVGGTTARARHTVHYLGLWKIFPGQLGLGRLCTDLRQKGNTIVDLRIAQAADIAAIEELIARSVMELMKGEYSAEQRRASIGPLFGVDWQIIEDGTYYVVKEAGRLVGSGGWSFRRTLFGGDAVEDRDDTPDSDAAHIRAFYVDPVAARTGIATRLLMRSEADAVARGFTRFEMAATLTGQPFYTRHGYHAGDKFVYPLPQGLEFPLVYMGKTSLP